MTTAPDAATRSAPANTGPQLRRVAAAERAKFPLVLKLFLLTSLLIVAVVGLAVGITLQRANNVARTTVDASISGASKLFREFERQRLGRLELSAQLVGADSNFVAYLQKSGVGAQTDAAAAAAAPPELDLVSILDQLNQRKASFGSDLLILLDDQGHVLARTDQPSVTVGRGEDLYEATPLVKRIIDDATVDQTRGVLLTGKTLYHAAVVPVAAGANRIRIGYLINAYAIDDTFANRIAESTNAGVLFAASPELVTGGLVARSSNAPSIGWGQISGVEQVFRSGKPTPPATVTMDRSAYVMTGEPLTAEAATVGAVVFVRSLDSELAPFVQIEHSLLAAGAAALILALIFSWLIARRLTRPIETLANVAQAVTSGNLDVEPPTSRRDEIGILGRSFAQMISALRDKAALEELYQEMAARSEERAGVVHRVEQPAKLEEGTILVTDLRGLPAAVGEADAGNVISAVTGAMKIQEAEVSRQDGSVREIIGHRLVSVFPGDRGVIHAIRAARAINEELASGRGPAPMSVAAGIATGDFVSGSVSLERESAVAIVGNAPLLASLFAWHAPAGHAYVAFDAAQSAGGDVMSAAVREEVQLKWIDHPLAVASLPLASMTTNVMRAMGTSAADAATMHVNATTGSATMPQTFARGELSAGQLFAQRYKIEQILGRGGMGIVYRAVDTQLDETVAIKTLPGDVMQRSPEDLERFKREIRLARKITHRNVLRTYDYGESDGVYFISMEFVRGYTLADCLADMPNRWMAPRAALGTARQICRGLQAAHEQGVIHRDIKPQNVLIDNRGEVKLMDFGIARLAESPDAMTRQGLIVGTPYYMSPEQVQGKQLDSRADVYSMGVLIYEMLVGRRPFDSTSLTGVLAAHLTEAPRPPIELRPAIGRDINAIIMRCLEKDPKARYADAGELLQELDRVQMQQSMAA